MSPGCSSRPLSASGTRRGNLMFMALFAILILGILTVAYHQSSRHSQAMAFRFEQSEVVRQIAEAAATEAFAYLERQSASPETPVGRWFLSSGNEAIAVPVPLTVRESAVMIRSDTLPKVVVTARHLDVRRQDSSGRRYYGSEGVGTLEIRVDAFLELKGQAGRNRAGCELVRHHDFKIIALVSRRDNTQPRAAYAQSFILDYALFVREGLREFASTRGENLNQEKVRLVVDQDGAPAAQRGRIFIGGTGNAVERWQSQNYVFLNVDEKNRPILPKFPRQKIKQVTYDELKLLFPKIGYYEPMARLKGADLSKLSGYFEAQVEPMVKTRFDPELAKCEQATRDHLLSLSLPIEKNLAPGFELVSRDPTANADPANAEAILEGAIRQRFLWFTHFHLDMSALPQDIQDTIIQKEKRLTEPIVATPMPKPPPKAEDVDAIDYFNGLARLSNQRPAGEPPILSKINVDFLYKGGQQFTTDPQPETFTRPAFFNPAGEPVAESSKGSGGLQVYDHVNLWTRRLVLASELETIGILDRRNRRLNLRGIIQVDEPVELGAEGPLTVAGQGVLMAGGFRILGGLAKAGPDDLAVLVTQDGNIEIQTDQPVEASLIALGDAAQGGELRASRPLKVRGMLAVERLNPGSWCGGEHVITYDQMLKPGRDLYQITLGRAITFQRLTEEE